MYYGDVRLPTREPPLTFLGGQSSKATFAINGRFYAQPVTGVQRYAREIVSELDGLLSRQSARARVILPPMVAALPAFAMIEPCRAGRASGHLWEQAILPIRAEAPLLNLCNTGPLALRRQIVCMHDTNVFDEPSSYSPSFRALYRVLLPGLAKRGAVITSVSRFSAHQLAQRLGIAPQSITVMYNGHEHVFRWNAAASELSARMRGVRPFVLLLGSRARHKNAAFILRQAEALDALGIDLIVAGGYAAIFSPTESVRARNIHGLGFVTDDDLAWLYAHALCLAFPSRSEGFGLPLLEAMTLGCPVIASNQSCLPEICGDAALLAGPDDAPAWLAHFRTLVASPDLRAELRGRGLERAKAFSWRNSAQGYLDLLHRF
ncbi:MAG: glycosyltransferase family 4 protein [Methylorubrum extorquens]|jgi:glycosyltransferase involved in cell wall biosynthesis|uniref:glycosyltransferase family 4 protein n=1 Tax=Methylorubrum extorquens TaxID=408 RepID=UPI002FEDFD8B